MSAQIIAFPGARRPRVRSSHLLDLLAARDVRPSLENDPLHEAIMILRRGQRAGIDTVGWSMHQLTGEIKALQENSLNSPGAA